MDALKGLLKALDSQISESAEMLASSYDPALVPVELDEKNFHTLGMFPSEKEITAVDGGNADLLSSAQLSLQFIRTAFVTYSGKKQVKRGKKEFFCMAVPHGEQYQCSFFGEAPFKELLFPRMLKTKDGQIIELELSAVGGYVRRLAELKFALSLPGFLVLDGNARAQISDEEQVIRELLHRTEPVGFLSKTSRLLTKNEKSLAVALHGLGPKSSWWYYPVFKNAPLHFVRLHSQTNYVFSLDISESAEKKEFIDVLSQQASDPVFLGYPYCLIAADALARVSNEEKEYLRTLILSQVENKEKLALLLSTLDAHGILDRIR